MKFWNTLLLRITKVLFFLCMLGAAHAWSHAVHRVVVEDAEQQLQPDVLQKLRSILGPQPLAYWANWADTQTLYPKNWHYVAVEDINAPCTLPIKNIACALDALLYGTGAVAQMPPAHRVRLLLHLVVDAHQPLHVDKTGFANPHCHVRVPQRLSLHRWMDGVVFGKSLRALPAALCSLRTEPPEEPVLMDARVWLHENTTYWDAIYPPYTGQVPYYCRRHSAKIPRIHATHRKHVAALMEHRLALASQRLVQVLHKIYE